MAVDPQPAVFEIPADDVVVVFRTHKSNIRGRLVRLGSTLDAVIDPHAMPDAASRPLAEALTLAALCGSAIPQGGNLNLQTRSDGGVSILVADYAASGRLRGYARYDAAKLGEMRSGSGSSSGAILGRGHLAITLDPGPGKERYQGVLAFDEVPLAETAAAYFEQRESMPTFIRVVLAEQFVASRRATLRVAQWHRRAGGLMMQSAAASLDDLSGPAGEDWLRVRMLAETVEDHELLDPGLSVERLLLRLFHEEAVAIERVIPLSHFCRCSREKVEGVLRAFGAAELADMRDGEGQIVVTCDSAQRATRSVRRISRLSFRAHRLRLCQFGRSDLADRHSAPACRKHHTPSSSAHSQSGFRRACMIPTYP
jgi:molecular chaperone Hsp33